MAKRILPGLLRTYLWQKKQLRDLKRHPNAVYGRFDEKEIVRYTRKGYLLNGISAAVFLEALEKRLRNQ